MNASTIWIALSSFLLSLLNADAQSAKPKPAAGAAPTAQKQVVQEQQVEILRDNERQFYYIADKGSGKIIKVLPYKKVYAFKEGMAMVETDKGIGFINTKGIEVVKPDGKYNLGEDFSEGMALVGIQADGETKAAGFINKSGTLVIPMIYQDAASFSENLAPVKKNNKWGYINTKGAMVIPLKYAEAYIFTQGLAIAGMEIAEKNGNKQKKFGYINKAGVTVIPFKYTYATGFSKLFPDTYALISDDNYEYHVIDQKGKEVDDLKYYHVKKEYNYILKYEEDKSRYLSPISAKWLGGKTDDRILLTYKVDYVELKGVYSIGAATFVVKPQYLDLLELKDGQFLVLNTYKKRGICYMNEKIPAVYNFIFDQDSLYYAVYGGKETDSGIVDGKFILYDYDGKRLTKYSDKESYDQITAFSEGLAQVRRNSKYGFINKKGEEQIPLDYDEAGMFMSGVAQVRKGSKVGVINMRNELVIPFEYDAIGRFFEGIAPYTLNAKAGIISTSGKRVTEPVFDGLGDFSLGLAPYVKDKKCGFVNTKGEIVIQPTFDYTGVFSDSLALVGLNGKVGFIDIKGNQVIECKYDNAQDFRNGCALVLEAGKYFMINNNGTVVRSY